MPAKMKFFCAPKKSTKAQAYLIYDASIQDKKDRREKAQRFDTATQVAEFLGVRKISHIAQLCTQEAILNQKRFKSKKQGGKLFIVRKAKDSQE